MSRPILILAALALAAPLVGPVAAQDAPASSGRYQIAPDEDGFVRLDTETGAISHCGKRDNTWRCEALVEDPSDLDRDVAVLSERVERLSRDLERLTARLDTLEKQRASGETPQAATPGTTEQDLDEALGFAERLMRRFFDMVRDLKNEEPPQHI